MPPSGLCSRKGVMPGKERQQHALVRFGDHAVPRQYRGSGFQRDAGQYLAGTGIAAGKVLPDSCDATHQGAVPARHPADSQPRQPVGLRHRNKGDATVVGVGGLWQTPERVALGQTVNFVAQQPDSVVLT